MHRKVSSLMVSQSQESISNDIYYVCQVVDSVTRDPLSFLRNIEDIFGDMASTSLVRPYPKWTCLHMFIEALVSELIFEDIRKADKKISAYWVQSLIKSNSMRIPTNIEVPVFGTADSYFEWLADHNLIGDLSEVIAKQVFHVTFSNRGLLRNFSLMLGDYVSETAATFSPDSFSSRGSLLRKPIPIWAKNAVFHRDKGRCVICGCDLTKVISQKPEQQYDHILPISLGGMNCVSNLQLMCDKCNRKKSNNSSITSHNYEVWYDY